MRQVAGLAVGLLLVVLTCSGSAQARGGSHSGSGYSSGSKLVSVSGYTRKDGTYVAPHYRSEPDGITSNNAGYSGGHSGSTPHSGSTLYNSRSATPRSHEQSTYDDVKQQISASRTSRSYSAGGAERDSNGRIKRSATAKNDFKSQSPCPSTGSGHGACPGYVVDHVVPLKRGGADAPSNMQWQTKEAAKAKDKWE